MPGSGRVGEAGLSFDPASRGFFDPAAVDRELRRVADICHTCRRCYNLCPSFDVLFRALDRPGGRRRGRAARARGTSSEFSDLCFECKLCIPHCPYYPPHRWDVDIPRLVLRDRAEPGPERRQARLPRARAGLGRCHGPGRDVAAAPIVNALNESRFARVLMEKTLGVHRDRLLPAWSGETFLRWWERRGGATEPDRRVAAAATASRSS